MKKTTPKCITATMPKTRAKEKMVKVLGKKGHKEICPCQAKRFSQNEGKVKTDLDIQKQRSFLTSNHKKS